MEIHFFFPNPLYMYLHKIIVSPCGHIKSVLQKKENYSVKNNPLNCQKEMIR